VADEKQTKLEKARAVKVTTGFRISFDDESCELALAWAKGDVTTKQAQHGMGVNDHATLHRRLAVLLQHMVMTGRLVEK
jgi:hypothetical protein